MFTGIVEATGIVKEVISNGSNKTFWVESILGPELRVDQSISHSGVCLTIEETRDQFHRVTAIAETIEKTNLMDWKAGSLINLERCLKLDSRLDGHLVQGHVDGTGVCVEKIHKAGSWEFVFKFPGKFKALVIEKGSICINGVSLTAFEVKKKSLKVAIIPYTFDHTDFKTLRETTLVNLEFDVIGKYILRAMQTGKK